MSWKELFYKPIKVKALDENILFYGCIHHNHDPKWETPIWKTRGYNSAKECDDGIINNWNSKANENTIGFLLGDTVFGDNGLATIKALLARLNFKELWMMPGNHPSGYKQLLEECDDNVYRFDNKTVYLVPNYLEAFINGKSVVMSHFPILSYNGQSKGSYMLHAHTHNNLSRSKLGKAYQESGIRVYEVSVENNPFPPNFREIKNLLEAKPPVSVDHHDNSTQNSF